MLVVILASADVKKKKKRLRKSVLPIIFFISLIVFIAGIKLNDTNEEIKNKTPVPVSTTAQSLTNNDQSKNNTKDDYVQPGMTKYDPATGTWTQGKSQPLTTNKIIKLKQLTPDNFFEEIEKVFVPAKITSKGIYKFNDWNDGLNFKTRYPKYSCVDLTVGLPTEDLDLALKLSYDFYKTLYHTDKNFRIGYVFLKFEVANKFERGYIQVSLGENALKNYFSKGDGNKEDFISWVEKNKSPENGEYVEDDIWINGGFRGSSKHW